MGPITQSSSVLGTICCLFIRRKNAKRRPRKTKSGVEKHNTLMGSFWIFFWRAFPDCPGCSAEHKNRTAHHRSKHTFWLFGSQSEVPKTHKQINCVLEYGLMNIQGLTTKHLALEIAVRRRPDASGFDETICSPFSGSVLVPFAVRFKRKRTPRT